MSTDENVKKENELITKVKENLKNLDTWLPVLVLAIFGVIYFFVLFWIILLLFAAQFLFKLFTGETNKQLKQFSAGLTQYVSQILLYITYQSDDRPFPLSPWPGSSNPGSEEVTQTSVKTSKKKTSKKED